MTVAELRAALEGLPAGADAWTVVLSRDREGNAFRPLRDVGRGFYEAGPAGAGHFLDEWEQGVPEPEYWTAPLNALCLWPLR